MKKSNYIVLTFFLAIGKLFAKVDTLYDSSKLYPKNILQKPSEIYTGRDFIYENAIQESGIFIRFLLRIYIKVIKFLNSIFNLDLKAKTTSGQNILFIILFSLLIILLVIGIIFFYKKFHKTLGRNDESNISVTEAEKNINSIDFDKLINNAIQGENYRLAIRFYYLKNLKLMSDQKIINYEYQKTSYEYFYEINNIELRDIFKELSFIFDYCWYGDHFVKESDLIIVKNKYLEIQKIISKLQIS